LSREKVEKGEREGEGEARRGEGERGREEAQGNKRPRGRALQVKAASAGPQVTTRWRKIILVLVQPPKQHSPSWEHPWPSHASTNLDKNSDAFLLDLRSYLVQVHTYIHTYIHHGPCLFDLLQNFLSQTAPSVVHRRV
jgi:hypothetical protein